MNPAVKLEIKPFEQKFVLENEIGNLADWRAKLVLVFNGKVLEIRAE